MSVYNYNSVAIKLIFKPDVRVNTAQPRVNRKLSESFRQLHIEINIWRARGIMLMGSLRRFTKHAVFFFFGAGYK